MVKYGGRGPTQGGGNAVCAVFAVFAVLIFLGLFAAFLQIFFGVFFFAAFMQPFSKKE